MKKNILIVDDSALMRRVLSDIIESDIRFAVKDVAKNGADALNLIMNNYRAYDAVILDINMPVMDGLEVLKNLKEKGISVNVIVVSSLVKKGAKETIIALEHGALDFVTKPGNYSGVKSEDFRNQVINSLTVACDMKGNGSDFTERTSGSFQRFRKKWSKINTPGLNKLVAIASSTGGPQTLRNLISGIPADIDAPVLIVQHMPAGFTKSLADRLNDVSKLNVKEAEDGDRLKKGWAYVAPGGMHMRVREERREGFVIRLTDEPPSEGVKPCANLMYESVAGLSFDRVVCVVLTGMGADGTKGIKELKSKNKNVYVIAQDNKTSIVYGMPKAVAAAGLADEILPIDNIADAIIKNTGVLNNGC